MRGRFRPIFYVANILKIWNIPVFQNGEQAMKSAICNFCHSGDTSIWYDDSYYWDVEFDAPDNADDSSSSESTEDV